MNTDRPLITIEFAQNGVLMTTEWPERGSNPRKVECQVYQDIDDALYRVKSVMEQILLDNED